VLIVLQADLRAAGEVITVTRGAVVVDHGGLLPFGGAHLYTREAARIPASHDAATGTDARPASVSTVVSETKETTVMSKKSRTTSTLTRALLLGILSGGRSATPLAVLGLHQDDKHLAGDWQKWKTFDSSLGRAGLVVGAAGEIIGDKMPKTPNRIAFPALLGRIGAGAFVGLALGTTTKSGKSDLRIEGAIVGAIGALVGSYVAWAARKAVGTVLPDPVVAVAEDVAVIAGSRAVVRAG
jgi:uncharacterized membrane protein